MGGHLERDELMATARARTGLDDFGDIPFLEPLDVLVESLNREAGLEGAREQGAAATLTGLLSKRLQLVNDRQRFPAIADEVIEAPVFIVGLPRTGSTHLHALMGEAEGIRTPRYWEMALPSPPPERDTYESDPRIAEIQAVVDQIPAEMFQRHPMSPTRPEQCNMLYDWSFMNQALLAYYDIPSYRDWLLNADYRPALETHRRTLQHLQWHNPGRWVLKYPKHLIALDVLLEAYPDACLIWTHRDPAVVLPSVCSLTGFIRSPDPAYEPLRFGPEWVTLEELVLHRGLAVRDRLADADTRIYDIHYTKLMRDPLVAVTDAFAHFDIPFTDESERRVEKWITEHPKTEHGVHAYRAEDFGLDANRLRERFAFYSDRFGVEAE